MIDFSAEGFNDLNAMLTELGGVLGKKVARKAARNAMKPVLHDLQTTAPYDELTDDGVHIRDAFKLAVSGRSKKQQRSGSDVFLTASVKTSNKEVNKYAALVEYGHGEHTRTQTNVYGIPVAPFNVRVKETKSNPFMRPALRRHQDSVVRDFGNGIINEIARIARAKERKEQAAIRAEERRLRAANGG